MAKLKAHGHELGTVERSTTAKRYMSDGAILKNNGFGWKIYGKVKDGVAPQEAFTKAIARQNAFLAERPAYASYRKILHDMAPLSKRWKLQAAVELLGDDIDGIWSECCDGYGDNIHADLDEIRELVGAYDSAIAEMNLFKSAKVNA